MPLIGKSKMFRKAIKCGNTKLTVLMNVIAINITKAKNKPAGQVSSFEIPKFCTYKGECITQLRYLFCDIQQTKSSLNNI
jgi:hypothetical protein